MCFKTKLENESKILFFFIFWPSKQLSMHQPLVIDPIEKKIKPELERWQLGLRNVADGSRVKT